MFGHDDIGPDEKEAFFTSYVPLIGQKPKRVIVCQKLLTFIAGKRQKMGMIGVIVSSSSHSFLLNQSRTKVRGTLL